MFVRVGGLEIGRGLAPVHLMIDTSQRDEVFFGFGQLERWEGVRGVLLQHLVPKICSDPRALFFFLKKRPGTTKRDVFFPLFRPTKPLSLFLCPSYASDFNSFLVIQFPTVT